MALLSARTSLLAAATAFTGSALAYPFLPPTVATHFDIEGKPDRFSSRARAAIEFPAVMMAIHLVDRWIGGWPGSGDREPATSGVEARAEAMAIVELALLAGHLETLVVALGLPVDRERAGRAMFGALMVAIGNVLPKLPRNSLAGIRTPWTLADPTVWERTHRMGGYLVTASGLVGLVTLPLSGKRVAKLPVAMLLASLAVATAYSFVAYSRRDSEQSGSSA